ncbi:heterokaryon incompatibility protein-domain-containing protein [Macrophomina phaseolina]|uniref:Heterokaryon incompatibility protein-domain-containing protein n=1 Tax=Macrophomina phaseolina TaxID=35725 RepID=A0ABQ8GLQ1_9PEZI|nr:heterokaryon incompatibility protein-domain-containing protein [Macrophomina phaseolina]
MGIPNHSNNAEEPGSGNSSKPAEDYLALSYTWGPPAPRGQEKFIKVIDTDESYRIDVKPNLHAALVRLRHWCAAYVFLWIDAICINQNDNREKSAQIPRMSEIYNGAKRVCIWLGPAGENSNTAMDFVHECLNLDDFDRRFNQEFSEKWHAVSNLLRRPWFSRRWIVQELARARKAEVYCGDHMPIQWQDFADGVSLMSSYQKDIKRVFFESQQFGHHPDFVGDLQELAAVKLIHIVNNVFRKSDNGEVIEELLSLDALMSSLPAFEASDPRDVMYAIFRMKENATHKWVGRVIEKWIIVDYDRSVFQVCKDYLKFSLARSKSLDMLLCPWAPIERPGDEPLPSWIPKLSEKPFGPDADGVYRRVNADTLVGTPGLTSRIYSASRNTRADVKWCPQDEKSISVKGFILDRVASKGSCAMEGVIPADWLTTGNWDDGGELPPDRFWRSLIGNLDSHGHRPPPHWKRICRDAFKRRRYGGNLDTKQIINHGGPSPIREFLERVQCVIWQRRMITLKQLGQRSIGIGPKAVKKGDLVCILYGCSVPVVLRQMVDGRPVSKDAEILAEEDRGDVHYQVVGECFIHGMMNGEAWALKGLDPREREREFKLH